MRRAGIIVPHEHKHAEYVIPPRAFARGFEPAINVLLYYRSAQKHERRRRERKNVVFSERRGYEGHRALPVGNTVASSEGIGKLQERFSFTFEHVEKLRSELGARAEFFGVIQYAHELLVCSGIVDLLHLGYFDKLPEVGKFFVA